MSSAENKLARIANFSLAGLGVSKVYVERERKMFELSNHSCYSEGWAAGYAEAMRVMADFISDVAGEEDA